MGSASGGFPRLKDLSVGGGIEWPMNVATKLTAFELRGPIDLRASALVEFFRRNTSLQSLGLNNLVVSKSSRSKGEEQTELPYLTKLSVRGTTPGHILPLLNLPSLKLLWVTSLEGRNAWSGYDWSDLCTRLLVTTLKAEYTASPHKRITVEGYSGLGAQSLSFTEFLPTVQAVFRSLANISLASVTSLFLIDNMPEGIVSLPTAEICALLEHLPRVGLMRLCPSDLAVEVVRRLRDHSELCPELRELMVTVTCLTVTCQTCKMVADIVVEMVKARASGGDEGIVRRVERLLPTGSGRREEVMWSWSGPRDGPT